MTLTPRGLPSDSARGSDRWGVEEFFVDGFKVTNGQKGAQEKTPSRLGTRIRNRAVLAFAVVSTVSTLATLPRATRTHFVPVPRFDLEKVRELDATERQLGRAALDGSLPNSVRAIGELVRRVGLPLSEGKAVQARDVERLRETTRALLEAGSVEEIRQLRALQSELFLQAVRASRQQGTLTLDLRELGASFTRFLEAGWQADSGDLVFDDAELRMLFRNHFNTLTGLFDHPVLGPSEIETRWYYAVLFEHPPAEDAEEQLKAQARLAYVQALSRADPTYDSRVAEGILHLQLNQPGHATQILENFLAEREGGSWHRLARGALADGYRRARREIAAP